MEPISDKGTTGNFEITVNGELVWSKKVKNQGFFDVAPPKMRHILFTAIEATGVLPDFGVELDIGGDDLDGGSKPIGKCSMACTLCQTFAAIPAIVGA